MRSFDRISNPYLRLCSSFLTLAIFFGLSFASRQIVGLVTHARLESLLPWTIRQTYSELVSSLVPAYPRIELALCSANITQHWITHITLSTTTMGATCDTAR